MSKINFFSIEFYCEFEDKKVVPGTVDGFTLIGDNPYAQDDLDFTSFNAHELVDGDDNAPESGSYHVYIRGTYKFVKDFSLDGDEFDLDWEISLVKYWKY